MLNIDIEKELLSVMKEEYNLSRKDMNQYFGMVYKKEVDKLIKEGVHKAKIKEPNPQKAGDTWVTYVHCPDGKRKQIQGRTEAGFYKSLYFSYYPNKDTRKNETITISSIFEETTKYRRDVLLNSEETINRVRNDYKKFYEGTEFANVPIKKITTENCEDFFNGMIRNGMKEQCFNNVIGVANCIFDYARRRLHIISVSPLEDAKLNRKLLKKGLNESDEERVYFPDERDALFRVIKKHLEEPDYNNKVDLYAILLTFKLGLRLGEVVALCYDDISYRFSNIFICKMQKKDSKIVAHTKTYEDRKLELSDYEYMLIEKVKECTKYEMKKSKYIFIDENGKPRTARSVDNTLRKLCDEAGIHQKSSHDIRRTVASEMHEKGLSVEEIRCWLGHKKISTTQGYIYNLKRTSEYGEAVHESLKNNEIDLQ